MKRSSASHRARSINARGTSTREKRSSTGRRKHSPPFGTTSSSPSENFPSGRRSSDSRKQPLPSAPENSNNPSVMLGRRSRVSQRARGPSKPIGQSLRGARESWTGGGPLLRRDRRRSKPPVQRMLDDRRRSRHAKASSSKQKPLSKSLDGSMSLNRSHCLAATRTLSLSKRGSPRTGRPSSDSRLM